MEALIEIATDSTGSEQVFFMDGPYSIEILRLDWSLVELRFLKGTRAEDVLLLSVEGEIKALLADAVGVSEKLLSECRRREWSTNDTSPLLEATQIDAALRSRWGE